MNDNSLYAQLAATSLQIVNWAHGNHLMVLISTLQHRLLVSITSTKCGRVLLQKSTNYHDIECMYVGMLVV